MRIIFIALVGLISFASLQAQELDFSVQVITPKLQQVDPKVFVTLENTISEFLNNTKWTDNEYEDHEKIQGNFTLTILDEFSATNFAGEIRIQSLRPVFNSNYTTPLLNIVDKQVDFAYLEYQAVENSSNTYIDNLSSILTFYVYMILGYDYDSFSPLGGESFFQKAQGVVNSLPSAIAQSDNGWKSLGIDINRFYMLENVLNPKAKSFRSSYYDYHRSSLDEMHQDTEKSKAIMVSALTTIFDVNKRFPNSMIVRTFADTKREEIVEIFKDATRGQQEKVFEIMSTIDPSQSSLYREMK